MKDYLDGFWSDCSYRDQAVREILEQLGAPTCSMFMFLAQANLHETSGKSIVGQNLQSGNYLEVDLLANFLKPDGRRDHPDAIPHRP